MIKYNTKLPLHIAMNQDFSARLSPKRGWVSLYESCVLSGASCENQIGLFSGKISKPYHRRYLVWASPPPPPHPPSSVRSWLRSVNLGSRGPNTNPDWIVLLCSLTTLWLSHSLSSAWSTSKQLKAEVTFDGLAARLGVAASEKCMNSGSRWVTRFLLLNRSPQHPLESPQCP